MAAKKKAKKKVSKRKVSKKKTIAKKARPLVKVSAKLSKKVSDFILMKVNITAANKQLTEMKSAAAKLESELMTELEKLNQLGVTVKAGSISIKEKDVFNAKDWKKINKWIEKTKNYDIYQRRLNTTLLNDMFKDGKRVAGVEHFVKTSLSHSKAK